MKKLAIVAVIIAAFGVSQSVEASSTSDKVAIGITGILVGKLWSDRQSYSPAYPGYEEYSSMGYYSSSGTWYPFDKRYPRFKCRGNRIDCAYQMGVYERERAAFNEAKKKAYECGRWGRCK